MNLDSVLLLTPEEVARRLSVGRTKVFDLIASEQIESVKIGRSRRISVMALNEYVERIASDPMTAIIPDTEG